MPKAIDRQPLLDTQQNQLGALLNHSASIDAKALGLLAAIVAVLIFIGQAKLVLAWWQWIVLLTPYFAALVYTILAVLPRNYVAASINLDDHPEYLILDKEALVLQLLADTKLAIQNNQRLNNMRWRYCELSLLLSLAGTLVLLVLLGVY